MVDLGVGDDVRRGLEEAHQVEQQEEAAVAAVVLLRDLPVTQQRSSVRRADGGRRTAEVQNGRLCVAAVLSSPKKSSLQYLASRRVPQREARVLALL